MYTDELIGRHQLRNREDSIDEIQTDIDIQSLRCIEELENEDWHSKYRTTRAHDDRPVGFFAIDPGMASRNRFMVEQRELPRVRAEAKEESIPPPFSLPPGTKTFSKLNELPHDLLLRIVIKLPFRSRMLLSSAAKGPAHLVKEPVLWR